MNTHSNPDKQHPNSKGNGMTLINNFTKPDPNKEISMKQYDNSATATSRFVTRGNLINKLKAMISGGRHTDTSLSAIKADEAPSTMIFPGVHATASNVNVSKAIAAPSINKKATVALPYSSKAVVLPEHQAEVLCHIISSGLHGITSVELRQLGILSVPYFINALKKKGACIFTCRADAVGQNGKVHPRVAHYHYEGWGDAE